MDAETLTLSLLIGAALYSTNICGRGELDDAVALDFLRFVDNVFDISTRRAMVINEH